MNAINIRDFFKIADNLFLILILDLNCIYTTHTLQFTNFCNNTRELSNKYEIKTHISIAITLRPVD